MHSPQQAQHYKGLIAKEWRETARKKVRAYNAEKPETTKIPHCKLSCCFRIEARAPQCEDKTTQATGGASTCRTYKTSPSSSLQICVLKACPPPSPLHPPPSVQQTPTKPSNQATKSKTTHNHALLLSRHPRHLKHLRCHLSHRRARPRRPGSPPYYQYGLLQ